MENAIATEYRGMDRDSSSAMYTALKAEATELRRDILEALYHSGGGHYGGCLSVIDILVWLYRSELRASPADPYDHERDRLVLSKGHAALALYAVLRRLGYISESLNDYASFDSCLEGHPDMTSVVGVDFSSGSLGQGLSVGLGMAYALRQRARRVWVVLGDGECQEGQVWEAAMLAAACEIDNLHAVIDSNGFQEWGRCASTAGTVPVPVADLANKWQAFGWRTAVCDGHDFCELEHACSIARTTTGRPTVIIAHTIKGKGVPMLEAQPQRFHCDSVSDAEHQLMMGQLGLS